MFVNTLKKKKNLKQIQIHLHGGFQSNNIQTKNICKHPFQSAIFSKLKLCKTPCKNKIYI